MINRNDFKTKLAKLRNECGLSQNRLAAMIGVSAQAVSKWETGVSLPDIDLLPGISRALGVSIGHLLEAEAAEPSNAEAAGDSLLGFDIPDDSVSLLSAMSGRLTRKQLYQCARLVEDGKLSFELVLKASYQDNGKQNALTKALDVKAMTSPALAGIGAPLADLAIRAVNHNSNPIQEVMHLFRCPDCGGDMQYTKHEGSEYLSCGKHQYPIVDGVVDFGSLEIHGYTWSTWLRSYDKYKTMLEEFKSKDNPSYAFNTTLLGCMADIILERRPSVILDIGSGLATNIRAIIADIDWPCTIILTDISHRVLKYDKRLFDENTQNPNVNMVYLACDFRALPVKDSVVPMVVSFGGFEAVNDSIDSAFSEAYRVLAVGGCLNSSLVLVEDRLAAGTQRWLRLIQSDTDPDMPGFQAKIFDVRQWREKLRGYGFRCADIQIGKREDAPPDVQKFPYNCEVARWMAGASVVATKESMQQTP